MYEVRSALKSGEEICRPFDESYDAWKAYYALVDQYTDGDGAEKELASWSR